MGNYKCRRPGYLQAWQMAAADMIFRGASTADIIEQLWSTELAKAKDEKDRKRITGNLSNRLNTLKRNPKFLEYYKSLVTEWSVHSVGRALTKLSKQIDSDQEWLANKAANDVLTRGIKLVGFEDENTITVKVEGMPELGTPDGDG